MSDYLRQSEVEQELLQCVVCSQRPVDAKLLDCLHAACSQCMHGIVDRSSVVCPRCKVPTELTSGVMALAEHPFFSTFSQMTSTKQSDKSCFCDECDDDECSALVAFCRSCRLKLCDVHAVAHSKGRKTKHHELSDITASQEAPSADRSSAGNGLASCRLHGEVADTFCRRCRRVLCARCVAHGHQQHDKCPFTENLAEEARERLQRTVATRKTSEDYLFALQRVTREAAMRRKDIDCRADVVSDEISSYFEQLRQNLTEREEKLLESLGRKQRALTDPLVELCGESKRVVASYSVLDSIVETCLRMSDRAVMAENEGVLSRRSEALNCQTAQLIARLTASSARESAFSNSLAFSSQSKRSAEEAMIPAMGGGLTIDLTVGNMAATVTDDGRIHLTFRVMVGEVLCLQSGNEAQLKSVIEHFTFHRAWPDHPTASARSSSEVGNMPSSVSEHSRSPRSCSCDVLESTAKISSLAGRAELGVSCILRSQDDHGGVSDAVIKLQSGKTCRCEVMPTGQLRELRFITECCPKTVALSEDGRTVLMTESTSSTTQVTLVGDREIREDECYSWRAEPMADSNGFVMTAGVTTIKQHYVGYDKCQMTGWQRYCGGYARIVNGRMLKEKFSHGVYWNCKEVLLFEMNGAAKTLTITNTHTHKTDTIEGVTGPVRPCFGFTGKRRGIRLLPT